MISAESRPTAAPLRMNNRFFSVVLPCLLLLLCAGILLYYIIGPAEGYMSSDCTDSLRWAQAAYESGQLISESFHYAAILPFGGHLVFLPFMALFGYSMTTQVCGLACFALILIAALYYFARGLGYARLTASGMVLITMLILSSSPKLREIMLEHIFYYNLGMLFFCFGFGLALRVLRENGLADGLQNGRPIDWVRVGLLAVFSLLSATDGLQTFISFTLPLLCAVFMERFLDANVKWNSRCNIGTLALLVLVALSSVIGYLLIPTLSHGMIADYANTYAYYSSMSSWTDNFLGFFHSWFTLLGVNAKTGTPLLGNLSIVNVVRIFGGLVLLIAPFVLLFRYNKVRERSIRIVLIAHFAVSALILYVVTFGRLGGINWRLTPMLVTSVIATLITAIELIRQQRVAARIGVLLLALLLMLSGVSAFYIARMPADFGRRNASHVAAETLEARGLKHGYADFWLAEIITMLSDDEVQAVSVQIDDGVPTEFTYQTFYNCYDNKDTDRYFLLLNEMHATELADWIALQRKAGKISEEFTIASEEYTVDDSGGSNLFVYVFPENIF